MKNKYRLICKNSIYKNPDDLLSELQSRTVNLPDFIVEFTPNGFTTNEFTLSKMLHMRNSFNPIFRGLVYEDMGGLVVEGKFTYDEGIAVMIGFGYCFLAFVCVVIICISGLCIDILYVAGFACILVLFQWLGTTISSVIRDDIIEFIEATIIQ